jgi:hypothetical protein
MYRVRYYGELIHPDNFNKGILGTAIRGLNWVRWKLETFNQRLVLKYMMGEQPIDESKKDSIVKRFILDVEAEKLQKELTSPALVPEVTPEQIHLRAERYQTRGHAKAADQAVQVEQEAMGTVLPVRPVPIDNLLARLTAQGRAKRYTRSRTNPLSMEADFEPVAPERIGGEEYGPRRSSTEGSVEEAHSSYPRFTPYQGWRPPT